MTVPRYVRRGDESARISTWRGGTNRVVLAPSTNGVPVSTPFVRWCLSELARMGTSEVYTSALTEREAVGFVDSGFEVADRLHLLKRPIEVDVAPPPKCAAPARLRRAKRTLLPEIAALDRECFSEFWNLDIDGLIAARRATSRGRFRVAISDRVDGYAITGWGAGTAYLQRLAVAPQARRKGIARALAVDGIRAAARHRCRQILVNTPVGNEPAVALYLSLGFLLQDHLLVVLKATTAHGAGLPSSEST